MERLFIVTYEEEHKNVNCKYHTQEVLANNGQGQIRLTYNDFFNDVNKGE